MKKFDYVKVGDTVVRMLAGRPMLLTATEITDDLIICGVPGQPEAEGWSFSKNNGAEIDDMLGWDEKRTGSYLVPKQTT